MCDQITHHLLQSCELFSVHCAFLRAAASPQMALFSLDIVLADSSQISPPPQSPLSLPGSLAHFCTHTLLHHSITIYTFLHISLQISRSYFYLPHSVLTPSTMPDSHPWMLTECRSTLFPHSYPWLVGGIQFPQISVLFFSLLEGMVCSGS